MAWTSSLNYLSCRNPCQTPHSLHVSPLFTENPSQRSKNTHQRRFQLRETKRLNRPKKTFCVYTQIAYSIRERREMHLHQRALVARHWFSRFRSPTLKTASSHPLPKNWLLSLSRRLAATESIVVQWVLMAPHPMGSPLDSGFVCICSPICAPEEGPPLFVPWVTMGGPTHCGWGHPSAQPIKFREKLKGNN